MNHYERLKVSQDAPPEVIRAAYRALAAKLHPDRQGGSMGLDDAMHEQMVALNGAYEVLIDPKLRQDYDASLAPSRTLFGSQPLTPEEADHPGAGSARVDMDWAVPQSNAPQAAWPPSRRTVVIGGAVAGLVLLAAASWIWQVVGQHQIEQALSDQYAARPPAPPVLQPTPLPDERVATTASTADPKAAQAAPAPRKPTVAELARMSDEELLKVLPTLDADPVAPPSARAPSSARVVSVNGPVHHPLDGKPLALRVDATLVDPLAPEPAQPKR